MSQSINVLISGINKGSVKEVEALIGDVDVNTTNLSGKSPLHKAVETNSIPLTTLLLDHGAQVDFPDKYDIVPLVLAADNGNAEMVDLLISRGSSIKEHGYSALLRASFRGHKDVITKLVEHGMNLNQKDVRGRTLLHIIASIGYDHLIEHLIHLGAKLNLQDQRGYTALMVALEACNFESAKILLQHKANAGFRNKEGKTALDIAAEEGLLELIEEVRQSL